MSVTTLFLDGDNKQLRDAIFRATPKAIEQCRSIAQKFRGSSDLQTCRNIWNFLRNDITYLADGEHQKIKLPSALLRERVGDCKSFSLFTAGILGNLGIPFKYALTSYTSDPTPAHIYVKCDNGIIIDGVWTAFNEEKKPNHIYYQKPNMKISYIAGINTPARKSRPTAIGSAVFGQRGLQGMPRGAYRKPLGTAKTFMGIGRTGVEWAEAIGKNISTGQSIEYYAKAVSLSPMRGMIEMFISNNGGGIANFLYNAWLRTEPYYLPNQKRWEDEYNAGLADIAKQIPLPYKTFVLTAEETAATSVKYTPSAGGSAINLNTITPPPTQPTKSLQEALSPQRWAEYQRFQDLLSQREVLRKTLVNNLNAKYPENTRVIKPANDKSKAKYRDIEWWWFLQGGNPDDFNNAVKSGNSKSPRGKDANYVLNKAFNNGLSFSNLPLIIRGFVSAWGGDKFGLGDDGTFVVRIQGVNNKGIMGEPVSDTTIATTITAYSTAIIGALTTMMTFLKDAGVIGSDISDPNDPNNVQEGGGDIVTDESGMDSSLLLLIGAGLVGGYFLLKK